MFCSNCGNNCNPEHKFCNNCGALITPPVAAPAVEPVAPAVEPVAPVVEPVAPVVEPVAPVVEPVAPAVEPVAPVVEPSYYPISEPPVCCEKKLGLGAWIYRLAISFLPLIVTYFIIFLDSTGMFSSMVNSESGVKTLATVLLCVIGASIVFQLGSLIFWAVSKKKGTASRDWALCFIIVMVGIILLATLVSIGMSIFHDGYTKWCSFLDSAWVPFRYVHMLLLSI